LAAGGDFIEIALLGGWGQPPSQIIKSTNDQMQSQIEKSKIVNNDGEAGKRRAIA